MFDAILLMAGKGERSTLDYNKVFYEVNGKPLFLYSLELFLSIKECNKIILVVRDDEKDIIIPFLSDKVVYTIGGLVRQQSVMNGMKLCTEDIVLIHDCARPNIKKEHILNVYEATQGRDAAVLAVKPVDCIKIVENEYTKKTLDRNTLWCMQTPQGVNREKYLKAIYKADEDGYFGYDDVEILEKYLGIKAKIVSGSRDNLKVTTSMDLKIIEILMKGEQ